MCVRKIEVVSAYDVAESNLEAYRMEMEANHQVKVVPASSRAQAVKEADIAVTTGPILRHASPVIDADWVVCGIFACALDFNSYWKPEAVRSMQRFLTDDLDQFKYYRAIGYSRETPDPQGDLSQIVADKVEGRRDDDERIKCMNLGFAVEDVATASRIYDVAKRNDIITRANGTRLEL